VSAMRGLGVLEGQGPETRVAKDLMT
jgi:hypothetical protein